MLTTIADINIAHETLTAAKPQATISRLTVDAITCDVQVAKRGKKCRIEVCFFPAGGGTPERHVLTERQVAMLYQETKKARVVGLVIPHLASIAHVWRDDGLLREERAA